MQPIAAPPLVPARPLQPEAAAAAAAAVAAAAVRQPGRPGHPSFSCRRRARLPSVGERWQARPQRGAAATATVAWSAQLPPAAFSLEAAGEVDWRVHVRSHAVENVVHVGQRLEHRVQHRLAALPGPARRLMAGGIAGAFGKTSTAPLETIKMALVSSSSTGVRQAAADIWARGGVRAFFRGNSVDVLRTIPSRAIELATYEQLKKVFRRWNRKHSDELRIPDNLVATLAGGLAGVAALLATYSLETTRTRMALGTAPGSLPTALAGIVRAEGAGALFKGLDASIAGVVPYAALRLGSYDALKHLWRQSTGRKDIDAQAALLFGAVAGCVSSTAVYPLEVARRRMMAGHAYPHMAAALVTIARVEGVPALFNGVLLGLVKQAPQMAVTFSTYELAKQFLEL